MKSFLKFFLKWYLKMMARTILWIHKPVIIAIAGSTNKSFIRKEIFDILRNHKLNVWANNKSFNTEIGLPLSILRIPSGYGSYRDWLPALRESVKAVFQRNYPDYLVLELGVSRVGDMRYLLSIVNPKISIISDITQRYLEGFSGMDELAEEYALLAERTGKNGVVILNYDNRRVREIAKRCRVKKTSFGAVQGADWQAVEITRSGPGETIVVEHDHKKEKYQLNSYGRHNVYAKLASLIIKDILIDER